MIHPKPKLMTPEEVAELFLVEKRTVTDWAKTGRFKGFKTPGGQWRFHEMDVRAELFAHTSERGEGER